MQALEQMQPQQGNAETYRPLILLALTIMHVNQPFPRSLAFRQDGNEDYPTPALESLTLYKVVPTLRIMVLMLVLYGFSRPQGWGQARFGAMAFMTVLMHAPIWNDLAFRMTQNVLLKIVHSAVLCDFMADVLITKIGDVADKSASKSAAEIAMVVVLSGIAHFYEYAVSTKLQLPTVTVDFGEQQRPEELPQAPEAPAPPQQVSEPGMLDTLTTYGPSVALVGMSIVFKFKGMSGKAQQSEGEPSLIEKFGSVLSGSSQPADASQKKAAEPVSPSSSASQSASDDEA